MPRSCEITHVFQDQELRLTRIHNLHDIEEERASRAVLKSELVSRLREWLAGKSSTEHIVLIHPIFYSGDRPPAVGIFDILASNRSNVVYEMPGLSRRREDRFVNQLTLRIQLARQHTLAAEALERVMKAADTCKKVDELEL